MGNKVEFTYASNAAEAKELADEGWGYETWDGKPPDWTRVKGGGMKRVCTDEKRGVK
jgi:hypothetical protein